MECDIILASSSPRRIEMMKKIGIEPVIMPSDADETLPFEVSMEQAVMFLALKKALHVEKLYLKKQPRQPYSAVIIAADTIVYKEGMIGKPADEKEAEKTLKLLRNSSHFVATGVALVSPGSPKRSVFYDVTEVFFKDYSDDEIRNYITTDEPWDKAGSYAIQGAWGKYISHIKGNYDNVIGFPWERIKAELKSNWPEIAL
ncbi:MAG: Maf family protein [Eubacteriales bacterium]|nr:Maf family protein [Eubacteriales bacterium]